MWIADADAPIIKTSQVKSNIRDFECHALRLIWHSETTSQFKSSSSGMTPFRIIENSPIERNLVPTSSLTFTVFRSRLSPNAQVRVILWLRLLRLVRSKSRRSQNSRDDEALDTTDAEEETPSTAVPQPSGGLEPQVSFVEVFQP